MHDLAWDLDDALDLDRLADALRDLAEAWDAYEAALLGFEKCPAAWRVVEEARARLAAAVRQVLVAGRGLTVDLTGPF